MYAKSSFIKGSFHGTCSSGMAYLNWLSRIQTSISFGEKKPVYSTYQIEKLNMMFGGGKNNRLLLGADDVFEKVKEKSQLVELPARQERHLETQTMDSLQKHTNTPADWEIEPSL